MNKPVEFRTGSWREYGEQAATIRRRVFIEEQGIDESDEWDHHDSNAIHILAICDGEVIATARILIETDPSSTEYLHIGRVAVLAKARQQGIGSRLMRHIIAWTHNHYPAATLYLHAQTQRQSFYEKLGFIGYGSLFMDANIPHIAMRYQANCFSLTSIQQVNLFTIDESKNHLSALIGQTSRHLCILSEKLQPLIYDNDQISSALSSLARRGRNSQIRILVYDATLLIKQGHKLATLSKRLPSKITIRLLRDHSTKNDFFVLGDEDKSLLFSNELCGEGNVHYSSGVRVQNLLTQFESAWNQAETIPDLQFLSL